MGFGAFKAYSQLGKTSKINNAFFEWTECSKIKLVFLLITKQHKANKSNSKKFRHNKKLGLGKILLAGRE